MSTDLWEVGTQIMWRYGQRLWRGDRGAPHTAMPMTVVRDDAELLVAWLAAGTEHLMWARADGLGVRDDPATLFTAPRVQATAVWRHNDVLRVYRKGARWSTWLFFSEETGEFAGWYCNIETPHRRSGLDTISSDCVLDVYVEPDRTTVRKDEDELVLAVEQGRYTAAEAAEITVVAEEIEESVRRWDSPFCDDWESFRPDPTWPIPPLRQ